MINFEKFFYVDNIQNLDLEYIKNTKGKIILKVNRKQLVFYTNFVKKCKSKKIIIYIYNDVKLLFKLKLNKLYISSYNTLLHKDLFLINKNLEIIGSAHNKREILKKLQQGCSKVILSRLFKTDKKGFLGIVKFNLISLNRPNIIALGGINSLNYKKVRTTNALGLALKKDLINKPRYLIS